MDDLELPMMFCLLEEMREIPPADFLANAQLQAQVKKAKGEQKQTLGELGAKKGKVRRKNDGD